LISRRTAMPAVMVTRNRAAMNSVMAVSLPA
jgi:hypothetical protein